MHPDEFSICIYLDIFPTRWEFLKDLLLNKNGGATPVKCSGTFVHCVKLPKLPRSEKLSYHDCDYGLSMDEILQDDCMVSQCAGTGNRKKWDGKGRPYLHTIINWVDPRDLAYRFTRTLVPEREVVGGLRKLVVVDLIDYAFIGYFRHRDYRMYGICDCPTLLPAIKRPSAATFVLATVTASDAKKAPNIPKLLARAIFFSTPSAHLAFKKRSNTGINLPQPLRRYLVFDPSFTTIESKEQVAVNQVAELHTPKLLRASIRRLLLHNCIYTY
ncbi:uncharacterized protein BT62DRAFT_1008497 [Guyanagaster necrorhizus]|uniref:Uncharacterized protein n=1 Tax=Guyanagaster necrorhizus TaxID=856835 RepID=A0A9P8AQG8_9AGAR|nr:uncharacterized protein BT62DRAFT_1008497 [Guyanagaster necrorhizus MCA 3950]KAG7443841.1 hypothetical protein BT62DRAFT_1008497 [Guyanagaster necrorhizus MCA 3950]